VHYFIVNTLFLILFQLGIAGWNTTQAQFSTTGFDTVIIEKKYQDEFRYWFGEPYGLQASIMYEGLTMSRSENHRFCRWRILTTQDEVHFIIDFSIKIVQGFDLNQGLSPGMPNYLNLYDPPAARQAPPAIPAYVEPGFNGRLGYILETKSPVKIFGHPGNPITATLYTRPATDQPFSGILSRAKRAGGTDLPVLGHERYDPTLRDAGLVVDVSNRKYMLLCSGAQRRAWIFRGDLLLAMFQYDLDHIPGITAPRYDFRIEPYMFVRPGIPEAEKRQIPFLLMLARAAAELVKDSRYFY
jgi:hypothetical protein